MLMQFRWPEVKNVIGYAEQGMTQLQTQRQKPENT